MRYGILMAVCVSILAFAPTVHAESAYLDDFIAAYPAANGTRIDQCIICHTVNGSSSRNTYGAAWRSNGHNFANVANLDSDGDGFTNIQEINALTFPGNANDKPASTGSVTATLAPAGAVTAGAQWRVNGGAWQNSGSTVTGVATGSATVNFKAVAGWNTPADQVVTVAVGAVASATGTYTQIMVSVPNVLGQTQSAAGTLLTGSNLVLGQVSQQCSNTVAAGLVISSSPSASASVAYGSVVNLVISSGPCLVTVPSAVGQELVDAQGTIEGAGLSIGQVSQQCNDQVPAGVVISQNPSALSQVPFGSAVNLVVSSGPCPVTVPNVVGLTQSAASTAIIAANLVVGTVTQVYDSQVPAGAVISQTPLGGDSVPSGAAVQLTVSKGPQPVITGSVLINRGAGAANSANVTLALTWSENAVRMRFSDNGATWTAWESLKATRAYTLPGGDGYKTVRVQFIDIANNRSAVFSDYILLDTTLPTGAILINNNARITASAEVTLNLTYADTGVGVRNMRFSNDGATWSAWESAAPTKAWTLPGAAGYKTVRVQYRDAAGNYSAVYNDYILYQPV